MGLVLGVETAGAVAVVGPVGRLRRVALDQGGDWDWRVVVTSLRVQHKEDWASGEVVANVSVVNWFACLLAGLAQGSSFRVSARQLQLACRGRATLEALNRINACLLAWVLAGAVAPYVSQSARGNLAELWLVRFQKDPLEIR